MKPAAGSKAYKTWLYTSLKPRGLCCPNDLTLICHLLLVVYHDNRTNMAKTLTRFAVMTLTVYSVAIVGLLSAIQSCKDMRSVSVENTPSLLFLQNWIGGAEQLASDFGNSSSASTPGLRSVSGESYQLIDLPILPRLETNSADPSMTALETFFREFPDMAHGGLIHLHQLNITKAAQLRELDKTIFGRRTACGAPKLQGKTIAEQGLEYCFWDADLVSREAIQDFGYEREMWQWIVEAFVAMSAKRSADLECLGFLDAGVNVGDWASPIRAAVPHVPYFGIEGSPHTAAIAAANMLTSVEYHRRKQQHQNPDVPSLPVAPTALLPFPLLSWFLLKSAQESGGVCFATYHKNIGGQSIGKASSLNCPPMSSAGATFLPHALRHIKSAYQPSCGGSKSVWPSVYIAKFDIQGFEFRALTSAIEWLQQRPPCYLLFEVTPGNQQNYALMELVGDLGYDAVWRTIDPHDNKQPVEFPGKTQAWWRAGINKKSLADAFEADMKGRTKAQYKNYAFGFQDQEACIQRLLNG